MNNISKYLVLCGINKTSFSYRIKIGRQILSHYIHGRRKVSFERKVQIVEAINSLLGKKAVIAGPVGSPRTAPAQRVTISDLFPDTFKKISKGRILTAMCGPRHKDIVDRQNVRTVCNTRSVGISEAWVQSPTAKKVA